MGDIGHMDEAAADMPAGKGVQDAIQGIIAHASPGGIGHRGQDTCIPDGLGHIHNRHGGKICRGAFRRDELSLGLVAGVVGNPGIPDIHADPLRSYCGAASGLSDAKNHIRLNLRSLFQNRVGRQTEYGGDLKFT